ncbi:putative baseplate assembly protein [Cryptosporangium arvum]|uniref:putative baseplate assembly protein n=1 Tax=Cryptosporangium arvum TaxID=80871 RepID=UPI0004ACE337|nr:putative baseplate assembly protein [Cryptosporangium arvum]
MALPAPNLDDRHFQQFVDEAKRYIQRTSPEWTDHNVSDPGITLIEAVAHMVDQLVYRLNRVPEKNHLAFLDLLGVRLFPPSAAAADVTFWLSAPQTEPVVLPAGTEVATQRTETDEAVVFATGSALTIPNASLERVIRQVRGGDAEDRTRELLGDGDIAVFGDPIQPGDVVLFALSAAVPSCTVVLELESRVDGVGVDPRQPPLRWEAWTPRGWRACEVDRDSTGGLNREGEVVLLVPPGHARSAIAGHQAGWLRCRVVEPAKGQPFYASSPTLRSASGYTIGGTTRAAHAIVVRNELLGESTGMPGQRVRLPHRPVLADEPPLTLEVAADDGWYLWNPVGDFGRSKPGDRHYTLDATAGEIAFGPSVRQPDGSLRQYGAVPPVGAAIRAARYRAGGGRTGNVARGAIQVLRTSIPYIARVENRENATGGVDGETVEEAKLRAPIALRAQDRAVTARDYEELARQAAPEAARIACLGADAAENGEYAVRLLVVPQAVADPGGRLRFEQLVPDDALLDRVTRYLDERRPLGTRLSIGPPFYQGVTVTATVRAFGRATAAAVRETALGSLYRYLDPLVGGPDGTGWPVGRSLRSGDLFGVLAQAAGVELVEDVQLIAVDPLTGRRAEPTDRIDLGPASLFFSYEHALQVRAAR